MPVQTKTILVFGGSGGIGKAVAERFTSANQRVVLAARSGQQLLATAKLIGASRYFEADVADYQSVAAIFSELETVDVVINASGVQGGSGAIGPLWENDPHSFRSVIETNLIGAYNVLSLAIQKMLKQKISATDGQIILFSGGGATAARRRFGGYGASKTGLLRLVESCALELEEIRSEIGVFALAPGAVKTAMTKETLALAATAGEEEYENASATISTGGIPASMAADLCEFLITPGAASLRGRLIHVKEPYREYVKHLIPSDSGTLRRVDYPQPKTN